MLEWDLSALFHDKEALQNFTQDQIQQSLNFKKNYENKLYTLNANEFLQALKDYENLNQALGKIMTYVYLLFAKNTQNGSFYAQYEEECKKIEENLLFFELEFCELAPEKSREFTTFCKDYDFYLSNLLQNKRYNLSKNEERIMLYLSNTGANAFSR
ncbi:oligoendopeptidase F, partial [Campylobacter coli]